jgi:hypothetical protein
LQEFNLVEIYEIQRISIFLFLFYRPVILEIPHFASLRNREREIIVLRSDNGEKWTEHTGPTTDEATREVLGDVIDSEGKDFQIRNFFFYEIFLFRT